MHDYQSARYTIYFKPDILSLCLINLTEKINIKIDFVTCVTCVKFPIPMNVFVIPGENVNGTG